MITDSLKHIVKENSYNHICENYSSLKELVDASLTELENIPGVGKSKSKQIKAIIDLSKELLIPSTEPYYIKKPKDAYEYLKYMALYPEENLVLLCLNNKNRIIDSKLISRGTRDSALINPLNVFSPALKVHASTIILAHNHTSGESSPASKEDISITHRIKECGKLLSVELLDHIIVGHGNYFSFKEKGIL